MYLSCGSWFNSSVAVSVVMSDCWSCSSCFSFIVMVHSSYFVAVDAVGGVLELAGPVGCSCRCDFSLSFRSCHTSLQSWFFYRHVFSCSG